MVNIINDVADARVEAMKAEIVRARLALQGVTDPTKVAAVAQRMTVSATGALVGLDAATGSPGVGTGPDYAMSIEDVLAETGETRTSPTKDNPFRAGPGFSMTRGMLLWRENPELAERLATEAGLRIGDAR